MNAHNIEALFFPRNVAILGARENPSGWTARIFANLVRFDFPGRVFPVNPRLDRIWDVDCYPDIAALPEPPDHLVVMLSAANAAPTLREAARLGARSATLYAAGFSEADTEDGRRLERELADAIAETGMAVSGPNCLGNMSARARLLTLPDDRIVELVPGPVAMVGQSGTMTPGIGRALMARGIDVSYIVTSGNEVGIAAADYIDFYLTDPTVRIIFCLIEAVRRPQDFLAACRRARSAGKPVVVLKMGGSAGGRAAALAHTGSLAGALEAFDAIAGEAGVIRADTADQAVNIIEYLVASPPPPTDGVGVLVYSGGLSGLSTDAAERHGLALPPFSAATTERINTILGAQTRVSNPLDAAGFVNLSLDELIGLIEAVRSDPAVGAVLVQEEVPPGDGGTDANKRRTKRVLTTLEAIDQRLLATGGKPVSLISATSADLTEFGRAARRRFPRVALLNEPDRAFRTLKSVLEWRDRTAKSDKPFDTVVSANAAAAVFKQQWRALPASAALSEPQSKALLSAYGFRLPAERTAQTPDEAARLAGDIGFPVAVKAIAAKLTHKSDAGAVMLGVSDAAGVREACKRISANIATYDATIEAEGFLVAQMITGGIELVLGIQNDPEMGPVVMFGSGGVLLELIEDVAFGPPGLDREAARALISRTRAARLLAGYRGKPRCDLDSVVDAIVATGRIAADFGSSLESLDINPLVALPGARGAWALDALVVPRTGNSAVV